MIFVPAPRILLRTKAPGSTDWTRFDASRIKSLKFLDSEKQADRLTLEIRNDDERFPDDPTFDLGNTIRAQWGSTSLRPEREFVVQKWFAGVPVFKVEAFGAAILFHREQRVQSWQNQRRSDVVREIATRNGIAPDKQFIEDTEEVQTVIHQGGKKGGQTDAEFCRLLAKKESSNGTQFIFYVINGEWHFHRRKYDQQPRRTIVFIGNGMGDMRSYPQFEATAMPTSKAGTAAGTGGIKAAGIDPLTQKPIETAANNDTTKGRPGLSDQVLVIDRQSGATSYQTSQNLATPTSTDAATLGTSAASVATLGGAKTPKEAEKATTAAFSAANAHPVKCSVPITGDPTLEAKTIITLAGVSKRLAGPWYIAELEDTVTPGDYVTALKLTKDGLNKGGAKGENTTNPNDANKESAASLNKQSAADGQQLEERLTLNDQSGERRVSFVPQGVTQ